MIKIEKIKSAYRVYSTEKKMIKHIPTGLIHSEYVINKEPKETDYIELDVE